MLARFAAGIRVAAAGRIATWVVLTRLRLSGQVLACAIGTVAGRQGDFEFDEFVPFSFAALAVGDRQKCLEASAWRDRLVGIHVGIISLMAGLAYAPVTKPENSVHVRHKPGWPSPLCTDVKLRGEVVKSAGA